MTRRHALKAKSDSISPSMSKPVWMRVKDGHRQRTSPGRMVTQVLVWVPILACVGASLRMGQSKGAGGQRPAEKVKEPTEMGMVAVMRSAPLAAETEGGMPTDLMRIIEEPVLARAQTERVALLYRRWAHRNPLGAGQSALASWRLFDSAMPLEAVLEEWLALDPDAAMVWVVGESGNPGKGERVEKAFGEALAGQPVATRALWAGRFPDDPALAANVAAEWVRQDPDAASEWLGAMSPGEGKLEGLRAFIATWMEDDPAGAGAFVVAMEPGRLREMALATVAEISPGGLALEPTTGGVDASKEAPVNEGGVDWLVRREGREESPRTLKRKPLEETEP
jgi:hypothetical protein